MRKAITIYVDDDTWLGNLCAGFVCWRGEKENCVTFLNEAIPDDAIGIYLPFDAKGRGLKGTQWIKEDT